MEKYYIFEKVTNEVDIMKSKFISILTPINSLDEIDPILKSIKQVYPKARHYIYAYIFDMKQKSNDDGEPSGTAGRPTLDLLNKENLTNCLLVTVRYFGGIKLGAGRLLRTYVDSANGAIKKARKYYIAPINLYKIEVEIDKRAIFEEICALNDIRIEKLVYNDTSITFDVLYNKDIENAFKKFSLIKLDFIRTIENKMEVK